MTSSRQNYQPQKEDHGYLTLGCRRAHHRHLNLRQHHDSMTTAATSAPLTATAAMYNSKQDSNNNREYRNNSYSYGNSDGNSEIGGYASAGSMRSCCRLLPCCTSEENSCYSSEYGSGNSQKHSNDGYSYGKSNCNSDNRDYSSNDSTCSCRMPSPSSLPKENKRKPMKTFMY